MAPIGKSLPVLVAFDVEIGPAHKDTVEANLDPGMDAIALTPVRSFRISLARICRVLFSAICLASNTWSSLTTKSAEEDL